MKLLATPSTDEFLSIARILLLRALLTLLLATGLAGALPAIVHAAGAESSLAEIRARGVVRIGVKIDFAPFGMLDRNGNPTGFEVDLAHRIAQALGVRLQAVPVTTENRFQRLEQGLVDLIVATAGDTRERRQLATAIEPNYYGAGVTVMLRPEVKATDWAQIRGQPLCALQGAYFNKPITQRHIVDLRTYRSVRDALLALEDGRCVGYLYTDVAIDHLLKEARWSGYRAPFPSAFVIPWAISISRGARGTDLERTLGDLIAQWHRDGSLLEAERQWGIRPSRFLSETQALWQKRDASGGLVCVREADGQWPIACRNAAFVTAAETVGLQGLGLWLRETVGIDLSVLYDGYDRQRYLQGLGWTIVLSLASLVLALVLGLAGARLALTRNPVLRNFAFAAAVVGRSTPPLLQMYLLMFGVGSYLIVATGVKVSPLAMAVLALGLYHGAMIVFNLVEAAEHLRKRDPGFEPSVARLPELLALASVGIRGVMTNLCKATGIASAIAVPELLSATLAIIADQGNQTVMMNALLVVSYLVMTFWIASFARLERNVHTWSKGVHGNR